MSSPVSRRYDAARASASSRPSSKPSSSVSVSSWPLVDYEQGSVGTTWTMSFKAMEARNENASNLMRLWAFVDNKDLWHGLLQAAVDGGEQWPGWLCNMACNEVRFLEAARLLLRYSMIEA
ncbi:hypothetical protein QBC36DRAFT_286428 [Triangularia setosa]|uniref:Uncharacterized protein n=1 Tax=Triangularia setosa TaxID=2587417 RepID=A0AAN6WEK6_9PEZI|nr:hypothetical protein QBC36DRAFT_286428 [Podospora setosa]